MQETVCSDAMSYLSEQHTCHFVHETGTFTHQTEGKMVFVREIGLLAHGTHRILILSTAAYRGIRRHR